MESKLTSLSLDFNKVLIQLIIPGLTAIIPWFLLFLNNSSTINDFYKYGHPSILVTTVILLSITAGLIIENLGSWVEVIVYDKINKCNDLKYEEEWNNFLKLNYKGHEPVGHRYLRNMLMRL